MLSRAGCVLLSLALLAGCGFQLRGSSLAQLDLSYRLLDETDGSLAFADFEPVLKGTLTRAGLREASPADIILKIQNFEATTLDGAVDQEIRVAEKISTASLVLGITNASGQQLADSLVLTRRESYRIDRTQLLASFELQASMERNLLRTLADQVLRTLDMLIRPKTEGKAGIASESQSTGEPSAP